MSKFGDPPRSIFDRLVGTGLIENNGIREKNPRRVAAARQQHAQARKKRREAKEALAELIEDPPRPAPARRRPGPLPVGTRRHDRIIRAMKPGLWYARSDMVAAAGFGLNARGEMARTLLKHGLATRSRNPDAGKGTPTRPEPHWLHQLTPKGVALRELLLLLR